MAGRFECNPASLVTGFDAVTGDRKRQAQHKANQPAPKHLSHPAGVAARGQERLLLRLLLKVLCKFKAQLKMVCAGDFAVLQHFCNFSNTLNL